MYMGCCPGEGESAGCHRSDGTGSVGRSAFISSEFCHAFYRYHGAMKETLGPIRFPTLAYHMLPCGVKLRFLLYSSCHRVSQALYVLFDHIKKAGRQYTGRSSVPTYRHFPSPPRHLQEQSRTHA